MRIFAALLALSLRADASLLFAGGRCHRCAPRAQPRMSARLDRLALDQLQSVCHSKGLPVGGTKAELVARIEAAPSSRGGGATRVRMAAQSLGELTVYQLKAVCRAKGLPVSGKKSDLVARIEAAPQGAAAAAPAADAEAPLADDVVLAGTSRALTVARLKSALAARGLAVGGRKPELLARLQLAIRAAPSAAEAAAADADDALFAAATPLDEAPPAEGGMAEEAEVMASMGGVNGMGGGVNGGASPSIEVISETRALDALDLEDDVERRRRRRAERRGKLASYFSEEYAKAVDQLSVAAGPSYAQALPDPIAPVAALPRVASALPAEEVQVGDVSVSFAAPVPAVDGYRLAWCRSFDAATGEGTLVDLEKRVVWRVDRAALAAAAIAVPADRRALIAGEFVQYDPNAAAALARGGAVAPGGWVRGILGWPLMCQTFQDNGIDPYAFAGVGAAAAAAAAAAAVSAPAAPAARADAAGVA